MKKLLTPVLVILIILSLAACGDVSRVTIDYGQSVLYSRRDIDDAADAVKAKFLTFEGCVLYSLSFIRSASPGTRDALASSSITALSPTRRNTPSTLSLIPASARP